MPVFLYEGKSLDGSTVKGMIDLETQDDVKEMLRSKGIFPISVRENNKGATLEFNIKKGIPFDHLAILCRQFYFTLSAGVPMLRAIGMIKDQIEHKRLRKILDNVHEEVQKEVLYLRFFVNIKIFLLCLLQWLKLEKQQEI